MSFFATSVPAIITAPMTKNSNLICSPALKGKEIKASGVMLLNIYLMSPLDSRSYKLITQFLPDSFALYNA